MLPPQETQSCCHLTDLCRLNLPGGLALSLVTRAGRLLCLAEGEVYTWGKGARGRLGRKEEDCGIPKAVLLDESHPFAVTSVACCHGNTLLAMKRNI